ncbi:hypothetical protein HY442_00525 [Candidatus Parcubacteria bacterium]|nr:hypothetical protein [Candidatus Parcubacteria bacterium]
MYLVVDGPEAAERARRFLKDWLCIESRYVSSGSEAHCVQIREQPNQAAMVRALQGFLSVVKRVV